MKKNRYLPFGYHIQNGVLCIHNAEAAVVRQTFLDYQSGQSYRLIAEKLTAKKNPYLENRTDWNKHMVKRMLETPDTAAAIIFQRLSPPTRSGL